MTKQECLFWPSTLESALHRGGSCPVFPAPDSGGHSSNENGGWALHGHPPRATAHHVLEHLGHNLTRAKRSNQICRQALCCDRLPLQRRLIAITLGLVLLGLPGSAGVRGPASTPASSGDASSPHEEGTSAGPSSTSGLVVRVRIDLSPDSGTASEGSASALANVTSDVSVEGSVDLSPDSGATAGGGGSADVNVTSDFSVEGSIDLSPDPGATAEGGASAGVGAIFDESVEVNLDVSADLGASFHL